MVNGHWLLTGDGEPLTTTTGVGEQRFCPVATEPLSDSPREHRGQLQYRPVSGTDFGEDRYWLQVDGNDFKTVDVIEGDWLLMDASGTWRKQPDMIRGQPCVVRTSRGGCLGLRWLRYDNSAKPVGRYAVDVLGAAGRPLKPGERHPRRIKLPGTSIKPLQARIRLDEVLAIAAKMERQWC